MYWLWIRWQSTVKPMVLLERLNRATLTANGWQEACIWPKYKAFSYYWYVDDIMTFHYMKKKTFVRFCDGLPASTWQDWHPLAKQSFAEKCERFDTWPEFLR